VTLFTIEKLNLLIKITIINIIFITIINMIVIEIKTIHDYICNKYWVINNHNNHSEIETNTEHSLND
jgi:amino acid permease